MRTQGWTQSLSEKVEEWRDRSFDWSTSDCCQFAAEVVYAITGTDYREKFPRYESRAQAEKILSAIGGVIALASSVLGDSKHPSIAKRGDVVACDFGDGVAIGICLGVWSCAPGPSGLVYRPTLNAVSAWSI